MVDDTELLRRYAENRSEADFAEIVRRHLNLVYTAALRQTNGDTHLAQDVAQQVFADLALKAAALARHRVLAGWLFTSTRFTAAKLVRGEQRRRSREQEAQLMQELLPNDPTQLLDWARVRPVLDEVMAELPVTDREAVLLRFFEGRDFSDVGAKLRLTENAARMRVERALDKLHALLARRGMSSTTAALGAVLANQAVLAAPATLASTVTGAALASAGATAGTVGIIATFMTMTKLQLGIAGALAVAGTTGFMFQSQSNDKLRQELAALRQPNGEVAALQTENLRLAKIAVEVAELRKDDAELARLRDEAAALKLRLEKAERLAAQSAAAKSAADGRQAFVDPSKLDRMPNPKTRAVPVYPEEMKQAGIGGEVVVEFVVDSTGAVRNAVALQSSRREFETAAVDAVKKSEWVSGSKNGRQVNTRMQVRTVFDPAKDQVTSQGVNITDTDAPKP